MVDWQCCANFCNSAKWLSHTCIDILLILSSNISLLTKPLTCVNKVEFLHRAFSSQTSILAAFWAVIWPGWRRCYFSGKARALNCSFIPGPCALPLVQLSVGCTSLAGPWAGSWEFPVGPPGWQVPGVASKHTCLRGHCPLKCRKNVTLQRKLPAAVTWLSSGGQRVNMQPQNPGLPPPTYTWEAETRFPLVQRIWKYCSWFISALFLIYLSQSSVPCVFR